MDTCIDVNGSSLLVIPNHPVTNVCIDLKNRGVKIRFITEITKDNIKYCRQLMKIGEKGTLELEIKEYIKVVQPLLNQKYLLK